MRIQSLSELVSPIFAGLLVVLLSAPTRAQSSCASTGTGAGLKRLQALKETLARTDTAAVLYRKGFGLTGVDSASVAVVTDTAVCSAVTASIDSAFTTSVRSGPFIVVLVGSLYFAYEANAEPQSTFYVDRVTYAFKGFTP